MIVFGKLEFPRLVYQAGAWKTAEIFNDGERKAV
jgi:hypothetical protein